MKSAHSASRRPALAAALAAVLVLSGASAAHGQGFMVKPMRMEFAIRPGQTAETVLELRNTGTDRRRVLDLRLSEITQSPEGAWRVVDETDDTDTVVSCRDWLNLSTQSVTVDPAESAPVDVQVTAPRDAWGVYFAAIIAEARPPADTGGIRVVVRFLIPVIVDIQGRPVRQQVGIDDVDMSFREAIADRRATTLATLEVANEGRTYSRIRGDVRVEIRRGQRWRPVARSEFRERGIIPGVTLSLEEDLQRRLPSGQYRLRGQLYVDGRRLRPLEKEIDFEGDPDVDTLAIDTALMLEPPRLELDAAPGATRTALLRVENPGEDALEIRARAAMPDTLRGVAMGELRGDELSAAEWVQIRPAEFTLGGERTQNVRVIGRIPREGIDHARYYADLLLDAQYPDGQSAGVTRSRVVVSNARIEAKPAASAGRPALSEGDEPGQYFVRTEFSNTGNVEIDPRAEAELLGAGGRSVAAAALSGAEGEILPLGARRFAGTLDFSEVEPGGYVLRVRLLDGNTPLVTGRAPLRVEQEQGRAVVTVVEDAEEEAPETEDKVVEDAEN
ncbi:MAG: hypothetical protein ACOC95_09575 [Planctomycetota bacterium]